MCDHSNISSFVPLQCTHIEPQEDQSHSMGLGSFTEAIYASAVSNRNIKTGIIFFELKNIEIHTIESLTVYLCVYSHVPKSLQVQVKVKLRL